MGGQVLVGWILMTRFPLKEQRCVDLTRTASKIETIIFGHKPVVHRGLRFGRNEPWSSMFVRSIFGSKAVV